ncbi:hypothetical protein NL108_007495, partial [Boleophthalmus pectinirostris]
KAKGIQINLSEALQGKLVAYDTDGDGDFDVEDAKILLGNASSGQSPALDWLEEVEEEEGSDWLNAFFTFLYGLISPPDSAEEGEEEGRSAEGSRTAERDLREDDEDEEEEECAGRARHDGKSGQKVVIVGLQNQ